MRLFLNYLPKCLFIGLGLCAILHAVHAQSFPLNDTGQTLCYDGPNINTGAAVSANNCGDGSSYPRQDARFGRDAQTGLNKIGGGAASFDFSKIANNGTTLAASATLGSGPTNWACTRDNVTGLVWEVKTTSGLRNTLNTYTWYNADNTRNGGGAGDLGSNTCNGTLAAAPYNNKCNTQHYINAVNAAGLCGYTNWRLPTVKELASLVHHGNNNSIDSNYFPNTGGDIVWTSNVDAGDPYNFAWYIYFGQGVSQTDIKAIDNSVRLVR